MTFAQRNRLTTHF